MSLVDLYYQQRGERSRKLSKLLIWIYWWMDPYKSESLRALPPPHPDGGIFQFSFHDIEAATKNFSDSSIFHLSSGGRRTYKGYIDDWDMVVVIKRFSDRENLLFDSNYKRLCLQIHHKHIIHLIGYCKQKHEMITVHEFMCHNLLNLLYDTDKYGVLKWKRRLEICVGVARGLHYLHSGLESSVLHPKVRTDNIFLDEKWVAKLTHPLCEIVEGDAYDYMDPWSLATGQYSMRSDVYSFGVVLFEILCAEKPDQTSLYYWGRKGDFNGVIDPRVKMNIAEDCLKKFMEVALSCVCDNPEKRPTMGSVVADLELALELQKNGVSKFNNMNE